jgi:hypothetical protein
MNAQLNQIFVRQRTAPRARRAAEIPGVARNEVWLHGRRLVYRVGRAAEASV